MSDAAAHTYTPLVCCQLSHCRLLLELDPLHGNEYLRLHHSLHQPLMMETVSEMFDTNSLFTQLITQEDSIKQNQFTVHNSDRSGKLISTVDG
jgi:hypothetical protein